MRDFLDAILDFIVASSLTDVEFETVVSEIPILDQNTFDDLSRILATRDLVSTYQARLLAYYTAKGVVVSTTPIPNSQIYIGDVLE